jgi:hypothetical protein
MVLVSGDIFRTGDEHGLVSLLLCRSSDDMGKVARMGPLLFVGDCCILGDTCPVLDMTYQQSSSLSITARCCRKFGTSGAAATAR